MDRNARVLGWLGWAAAVLYVAIGVIEVFAGGEGNDDPMLRRFGFLALLVVLAVLVVVGIRLIGRRPWLGATLASVGAILGALVLFWTILSVLLGIGIVVLAVMTARRASAAG